MSVRDEVARVWFQSRHPQYGADGLDNANDWWREESYKAADLFLPLFEAREQAAAAGVAERVETWWLREDGVPLAEADVGRAHRLRAALSAADPTTRPDAEAERGGA